MDNQDANNEANNDVDKPLSRNIESDKENNGLNDGAKPEASADKKELRSRTSLQKNLERIHDLLDKQKLVENLIRQQHPKQHEIVESLVHRQQSARLENELGKLHTADIADVLEALPLNEREYVWGHLKPGKAANVFLELSDPVRKHVINSLEAKKLLQLLGFMDGDDLAYIADDIPEAILNQRLTSLSSEDKAWLNDALQYPEDKVGYLMSNEVIIVRQNQRIKDVQAHLRELKELPVHNDKVFVTDRRGILTGALSLQNILLADPDDKVEQVMALEVVKFDPEDDATEAADAFERYDLASAPVVNHRGKILGRLTVDVIVEYLREHSSDDIINMAGVQQQEDLFAPILDSARNRGTWLLINLFSAFISASIIGMFESAISQLVALAALMPIVASVGGNSGNQTTALVIRGLTMNRIHDHSFFMLLRKEISINLLNGIVLGVCVGLFALFLYHSWQLSLVIAVALCLTLVIAAILGLSMPMILQKFGRDPALGSSVLQTATTDSTAFLIFLGLASLFLL